MNQIKLTLEDLGYDEYFKAEWEKLGYSQYPLARVIAEYREAYRVISTHGDYLAKITGKQMFTASKKEDYPAVGDWVVIDYLPDGKAVIWGILPRKTMLQKKYSNKQEVQLIATNIDTAFIVESMDRDYSLNRFERYLVLIQSGKIEPVIVLNKIDLITPTELDLRINQIKNRFKGIAIISTSIIAQQGLNVLLKSIVKGKTYCFLGSSGVGKSSLINKLLGKDEIKTREISLSLERGKHTTTNREMYFLEKGGLVIDNPGTREVGIVGFATAIENVFDEISLLSKNCKFSDCSHIHEVGCAVLQALNNRMLEEERYNNYITLKKKSDFYRMTELEKREKDRKFGKFIKNSLKELRH